LLLWSCQAQLFLNPLPKLRRTALAKIILPQTSPQRSRLFQRIAALAAVLEMLLEFGGAHGIQLPITITVKRGLGQITRHDASLVTAVVSWHSPLCAGRPTILGVTSARLSGWNLLVVEMIYAKCNLSQNLSAGIGMLGSCCLSDLRNPLALRAERLK
jgi:hypothetical protein